MVFRLKGLSMRTNAVVTAVRAGPRAGPTAYVGGRNALEAGPLATAVLSPQPTLGWSPMRPPTHQR
jgi:hypothetical protein